MIDLTKVDNVRVCDIDYKDYPDFCDAYIDSADYDGVEMDEKFLDELNEYDEFVYECTLNQIY